jgi:hypothetical protein
MMGAQCDNCRKFAASTPPGWWILGHVPAPSGGSFLAQVLGGDGPAEPHTFCSAQCVAEWAYAQSVVTGPAAGVESAWKLPPGFGFDPQTGFGPAIPPDRSNEKGPDHG